MPLNTTGCNNVFFCFNTNGRQFFFFLEPLTFRAPTVYKQKKHPAIIHQLTAEEDDPEDIVGGGSSGACDPAAWAKPAPPGDIAATAAAVAPATAIAVAGACCAVVTTAADIPPPPPSPTPSLVEDPLVSTGIIAVSGNKLSPGPAAGAMGGRAAASKGVLSPDPFIPGSLSNGA